MTDKPELRKQLKAQRLALSSTDVQQKSQVIINKLIGLINWEKAQTLHCFLPIEGLNEVVTRALFEFAWKQHPSIELFTTQRDGALKRVLPSFRMETVNNEPDFDVIIVPMLGFDGALHRLGYGGGYYDQLLARQKVARKIGLCFDLGRLEELSIEPHDQPLDAVITENGVYLSSNR